MEKNTSYFRTQTNWFMKDLYWELANIPYFVLGIYLGALALTFVILAGSFGIPALAGVIVGIAACFGLAVFFGFRLPATIRKVSVSKLTWELGNKDVSVERLVKLSTSKFPEIRKIVAYNRRTPIETVLNLADDKDFSVQETALNSALSRDDLPFEEFFKIASGAEHMFYSTIFWYEFMKYDTRLTTAQLYEIAATTKSSFVRQYMTVHRNLDFNTMILLLNDESVYVRSYMYDRIRNMKKSELRKLVSASDYWVMAGMSADNIFNEIGFDKETAKVDDEEYAY